jgi:hypothetical protein
MQTKKELKEQYKQMKLKMGVPDPEYCQREDLYRWKH